MDPWFISRGINYRPCRIIARRATGADYAITASFPAGERRDTITCNLTSRARGETATVTLSGTATSDIVDGALAGSYLLGFRNATVTAIVKDRGVESAEDANGEHRRVLERHGICLDRLFRRRETSKRRLDRRPSPTSLRSHRRRALPRPAFYDAEEGGNMLGSAVLRLSPRLSVSLRTTW